MKNFFLKTGLTLLCLIIGLGSAWGEEIVLTGASGFGSNYGTTAPSDFAGDGIMYNGNGTPNQWASKQVIQFRKSGSTAGYLYNTKPLTNITNIKIYLTAENPFNLYTGTTTDVENHNSKPTPTTENISYTTYINKKTGTGNTDVYVYDFQISSEQSYFKIVNGSSANYVYKIVITYNTTPTKTLSSIAVKTAPTQTTYTEGENFNPAGLVITGTYSDASTEDIAYADHASDFTFSPALTTALTTSNTSVDITYGGKTTTQSITVNEAPKHTAHFSINGTIDNTKDCTVAEGAAITLPSDLDDINGKKFMGWVSSPIDGTTETAPSFVISPTMGTSDVTYYAVFATQTGSGTTSYEKLTSNSFDTSATYVLAANESSSTNTLHYFSTYTTTTANESWGVTSTDPADAITFTLSGTASALEAMDANRAYIQALATGKFRMSGSVQTLNLKNDGTIYNPTSGSTGYNLRYNHNNGSGGFRWYNGTTGCSAYFYKVIGGTTYSDYCTTVGEPTPAKTLTGITVTGTPAEFWKGDDFNHNGITVTAHYDDESTENVTASAEFSTPDMSTAGEKTVTVTYLDQTDAYNITVNTIANTQATAYTVAKAKELIDAGKDLGTEVYVAGKISQVDSYSSTYKSITYWISTDGTTSGQFEIFGGKGLENADFSSMDDVQVGAEVIVYGKLKKFNSTYELDSNNYLVSYSYTPPTTDFIKTPTATVNVLDPISIKDYINGEYSSYDITTSIDDKTQKDYEFVCIYDQIRFCKAGTYVVDVTGTSGSDTQNGQVTFTVTPTGAELSSVTIGGTLTKTIYTVGESFDRAGLTLKANCSDGSHAYVTDEAEWEASPATITEGTTKVTVTATYCGMTDTKEYDVTVNADYATLPFEWAGGVSADFTALTGVTASGLGSDYAASNAPYRIKLDNTEDYFQVKTNEAIGICTVGVKMIGGATASSIKVQGSADGESFTDVETLTISGSQNDVLSLSTTSNLDESYRYVRFVFTKGSNVGLGPITIAKPDNTPTYTVTVASNIEHGTVATSVNSAKENDEITVTVSPDTHYHLATLYYTEEGDATQNPITATDDEYSFTMPAANVTVSATFEEDAKYTIAWSVNGTIVQTQELYEGEDITRVDPESTTFTDAVPTGVTKVFTGWVTTPTVDANTPPSYETPAATAKENVTYYAVFAAKEEGTGSVDKTAAFNVANYADANNWTNATAYYSAETEELRIDEGHTKTANNNGKYYTTDETWRFYQSEGGSFTVTSLKGDIKSITITFVSKNSSNKLPKLIFNEDEVTSDKEITDISSSPAVFTVGGDGGNIGIQNIEVVYVGTGTTTTYSDFTTQLFLTTITVSKYGSTTLSLDKDYTMPEGLTGKIITAKKHKENEGDGYYTLTYVTKYNAGDVVPAGEALVIQDGLTQDESRDYRVYEGTATGEVTSYPDNLLCAEYTEDANGQWLTSFNNGVDNYYYKLTTKNGANFGWYYGDTDGKPFLMSREDRAYLVIAKQIAASIRGFALEDGEEEDLTTGIDNMETNSTNSIYNLQGLQQSKLQKGINIVNGKKVIR